MPTYEEIQAQVAHMDGFSKWLGKKEFKALPDILWDDEQLEKAVQGWYENGTGLLVATNKRLIFIDKGMVKLRVEDFPYDKMTSIQYETGWVQGEINIFASGNKAKIKNVTKDEVKGFCDYVRARITSTQAHASAPATNGGVDAADQIAKLAALRDQGILSEEEFTAKKLQLLGI